MNKDKLIEARCWTRSELEKCIQFWLDNGMDREFGGVYTCLDRKGNLYSKDKSVWMQGRCGWMFAYLCRVYGVRQEWLDASKSCLDFLETYCINPNAQGRMYFTVTGDGRPLRQRRHFCSEAFYALANGEYYGIVGEQEYLDRARRACDIYWNLWHGMPDPTGLGPKNDPKTRSGHSFGDAMIFLNVLSVMIRVDEKQREKHEERAQKCIDAILQYHYHPELKCILENVGANGEAELDYTAGRTVNPGHDLECVWFLLEHGKRTGNPQLLQRAEEIFNWAIHAGWDKTYGGILYFVDALGLPQEAYEHDMKLWWVHNEAMISALMLYQETGEEEYLDWYLRILDYAKAHFADPEYGEWYGYLRREGLPTQPATKGSTFKGPFHLPRMLAMTDGILDELLNATD